MADKMAIKEANVTTVNEADRTFIRSLMSLSPEKKILVKGILIGMDLQEKPATVTGRTLKIQPRKPTAIGRLILEISAH